MSDIRQSEWIWTRDWKSEDKEVPGIIYFRRQVELKELPESFMVQISADSRYKLYVNHMLAETGPSKGDAKVWFYETLDILPYLREGNNTLAVVVLRYPTEHNKGNHGIFRTETPGMCFFGEYREKDGRAVCLKSDENWKCLKERNYRIVSESDSFAPLQILEDTAGNRETFGWMEDGFDDSRWNTALVYRPFSVSKAVSPGNLLPRTIPSLRKHPGQFKGIMVRRQSEIETSDWNRMLKGQRGITLSAWTEEIVEIDAGELMTGFLKLVMTGGRGAVVKILQSEGYVQKDGEINDLPRKGDRLDFVNGYLHGFTDTYRVSGLGVNGKEEIYEPFWFRTFRFVQLAIKTGEEPLTLETFDYLETGYPLEVKTRVKTSDESLEKIWDISERTLRRCMHETYEDCPFYEQLQYAMDTRSQILYTFMVSADDRLARKCYDDFRRSQRYDGLLNCSYPNYGPNVIPGFSIYYILMLYDHMMYFGDRELIRYHIPTIDGILLYFDKNLTPDGIVGKIGGLNIQDPYWSFIDWTTEWNETTGVPTATLRGPATMESLLYVMGLTHGSKLAAYIGRSQLAEEYEARAQAVKQAVRTHCLGADGMLSDGPGLEEYSQHCQVFALLTDTVDLAAGRRNLLETLNNRQKYAQCSVAMAFYLYRALEKAGIYEYTDRLWNLWRDMLNKNLTTCVEDGLGERSDCHAWGALALYELPAVILGVHPVKPGFQEIEVRPVPGYLTWAEGEVITPRGRVKVSWKKEGEKMELSYSLPENTKAR